jgi:hypothetical protein
MRDSVPDVASRYGFVLVREGQGTDFLTQAEVVIGRVVLVVEQNESR